MILTNNILVWPNYFLNAWIFYWTAQNWECFKVDLAVAFKKLVKEDVLILDQLKYSYLKVVKLFSVDQYLYILSWRILTFHTKILCSAHYATHTFIEILFPDLSFSVKEKKRNMRMSPVIHINLLISTKNPKNSFSL